MVLNSILGALALLSFLLMVWQWLAGRRFDLHRRVTAHASPPAVTLLKPLKGCDAETEGCLRSWFAQQYTGGMELLFGVASADDPVCGVVRKLMGEFPAGHAQLIVCGPMIGANAKVSKLAELERVASYDIVVVSDADVRAPADLLANVVEPLREPGVGLVNCFYRLANATTVAMKWEAVAINADFWSQVLQGQTLKPIDYALGAVMATRRRQLEQIGGFRALADCLADDYQLGNRIARGGFRIVLSPVVVECRSAPLRWGEVWKHQLRWARTIRVCQPVPYFFSILSDATFWPLIWALANPIPPVLGICAAAWLTRLVMAVDLQQRLTQSREHLAYAWLVPVKDLLQMLIWLLAFVGNRVEWRGQRMRLRKDGMLER